MPQSKGTMFNCKWNGWNVFLFFLFLIFSIVCNAQNPSGLLGGQSNGAPWAGFLDTSGSIFPVQASLLPSSGNILTVDINRLGQAIIGGVDGSSNAYAAFTYGPKAVSPIAELPANAQIKSAALNDSKKAIIVGNNPAGSNPIGLFYTALIFPSQHVTEIVNIVAYAANGYAAAINNQGYCMAGGQPTTYHGYALLVDPLNSVNVFHDGPPPGYYNSVAINELNVSITGGGDGTSSGSYAAFVASNGAETVLPQSGGPLPAPVQSQIESVAINNSSNAIIGGFNNTGTIPYAALVSSSGNVTNLPVSGDPLPVTGKIESVAINEAGNGLIGGYSGSAAYAAFVSSSGVVQNLSMPLNGVINSVAISEFGAGLVGGQSGSAAYAAVISPSGQVVSLSGLPAIGAINSVVIGSIFLQIPTDGLTFNNKRFAEYINQYATQDVFYFIPALFEGTLAQALESAAPTRNAFSLFTADNNLFLLSKGLSSHLHNHRHFRNRAEISAHSIAFADPAMQGYFVASSQDEEVLDLAKQSPLSLPSSDENPLCEKPEPSPKNDPSDTQEIVRSPTCLPKPPSYCLWFEAIGAFASQKEQNQTPGFNPSVGGWMLALDKKTNTESLAGAGVAYTFTHISEDGNAGYSRINQEYLFGYATWANRHFYFDGTLWVGLFQTHQVRKIHLTGFDFQSISTPTGWQLSPHVEFGYDHAWVKFMTREIRIILDPFVMLDWANAWQGAYKERGNSPFNSAQKSHYSSLLRTELGLRLYETISFQTWRCTFEEKGSYVNKTPFGIDKVNAFLVGSPGSFTVETLSSSQNLGAAEFSLICEPVNPSYPYGSISYQGEFGSSSQSHQISAEVSWDF